MTPDALEETLAALAERADGHAPGDRVAAVHRRARRARRATVARVSVAAVAVVAVVVAVVAGSSSFTRRAQPAEPPRPYLTVELAPADDVTAALPPAAFGGVKRAVTVRVRGLVPQVVPPAGTPLPEGRDNLLNLRIDWGERFGRAPGSGMANDGIEGATCATDAPLVPVEDEFVTSWEYQRPGTYPVTYTTTACPPVGEVTQTLTLEVTAEG